MCIKVYFFSTCLFNEIFKYFTKRTLIWYYHFINIYIIYQNMAFLLIKFVLDKFSIIKLYKSLSIYIYIYGFNFLFFLIVMFHYFCWNKLFKLNFFLLLLLFFTYTFKIFDNFSLFWYKSALSIKFEDSKLLSQKKKSLYLALIYSSSKELSKSLHFKIIVSLIITRRFFYSAIFLIIFL